MYKCVPFYRLRGLACSRAVVAFYWTGPKARSYWSGRTPPLETTMVAHTMRVCATYVPTLFRLFRRLAIEAIEGIGSPAGG